MTTIWIDHLPVTPIGPVWLGVSEEGLAAIYLDGTRADLEAKIRRRFPQARLEEDPLRTAEVCRQIEAYLDGERRTFTLPIDWRGMGDFQRRALQATAAIPYGETRSYGEIAAQVGNPRAARAVGRAEATNPIPLVIPCHRVIGADGGLHGYGGARGLETKAWLLRLEGVTVVQSQVESRP